MYKTRNGFARCAFLYPPLSRTFFAAIKLTEILKRRIMDIRDFHSKEFSPKERIVTGMISLLLWAPFLLVALIVGLIFCIRGYKKGVVHGAIALGATVVATILSLLLALLISPLLAKPFTPMVHSMMEDALTSMGSLFQSLFSDLLEGIVAMIVATLLFPLLYLIVSITARWVAAKLSRGKFEPQSKGHRWGGLGVGALDALIYTLVLLLPLYGTIGSFAPTMGSLMDEETGAVFNDIGNHPLASISGSGPLGFIYDKLTVISNDGTTIEPAKMVYDLSDIIRRLKAMMAKDPNEYGEEELQLIQDIRTSMVDSDWFYQLVKAFYEELKATGQVELLDTDEKLTLTKKEVKESGTLLMDLVATLLEAKITGDTSSINEDSLITDISKILNSTPSAASFKYVLINYYVHTLAGDSDNGLAFRQEIMEKLSVTPLTDTKEMVQEGMAVMQLLDAGFTEPVPPDVAMALAQHPHIGEDTMQEALREWPIQSTLY